MTRQVSTGLALMAGAGDLPAAVIAALPDRPLVCVLDGYTPAGVTPDLTFRLERLMPLLRMLSDQGVTQVAFAGALGPLQGRGFRIGHLGDQNPATILGALGAVEAALEVQGIPLGAGGTRRALMHLAGR